jgi:molecular chaperone DnaJ
VRAPGTDHHADLYAVLGVARAATGAEIRRAYRRLALAHHPDQAGPASAETFARIAEAYHMLSNPTARTAYDAHLFERERAFGGGGGQAQSDARAWSVSAVGWSASWQKPIANLLPRLSGPIERLTETGAGQMGADGVLELHLDVAEAARGGTALVELPLPMVCPTCGGVARPGGVWCLRCDHAGRVTETVAVVVVIPPAAPDGLVVAATLRQAGGSPQRARLRVAS